MLRKIRGGGFQRQHKTFTLDFYDILEAYDKRIEKASRESLLPDNPDMEKVEAFVEYVNRKAIEGGYLEGNTWD